MKLKSLLEMPSEGNLVYHSTSLEFIKSILDSNVLRADTHHPETDIYPELKQRNAGISHKEIQGVSLTRDKKFAEEWADCVLVLDINKIKQNYKVKQVAYFADDAGNNREESEEFVIGSIKNLNRYLTGIYFPARLEKNYTDWKWVQKNIKPVPAEFEGWKRVLEDPKYTGKELMNSKKAVGETIFLDEQGRIIPGVNTPPGITVDHTQKMAAALGFTVNKDGYAPIMPTDGKINREAPAEKNHSEDDDKSMFTGADLTPLTDGSGPDMIDADNTEEPKDVELGTDEIKDENGIYQTDAPAPLENK